MTTLDSRGRSVGLSIAIHAVIVGLLAIPAARSVTEKEEQEEPIEFELLPPGAFVQVTEKEVPELPDKEPPKPPPVPDIERPEVVPERTKIKKVVKARPLSERTPPEPATTESDAEAVADPTAPMPELDMGMTVGTTTTEYVTTSETGGTLGFAKGPGGGSAGNPRGIGERGPLANQGARHIEVSKDWEITRMPRALNKGDFEPDYPTLAKREGRESVVVVRLYIDAAGRVANAKAIEGPTRHGFRQSALRYARRLRFKPAMAGNHPVAARIDWSVHFYVRN